MAGCGFPVAASGPVSLIQFIWQRQKHLHHQQQPQHGSQHLCVCACVACAYVVQQLCRVTAMCVCVSSFDVALLLLCRTENLHDLIAVTGDVSRVRQYFVDKINFSPPPPSATVTVGVSLTRLGGNWMDGERAESARSSAFASRNGSLLCATFSLLLSSVVRGGRTEEWLLVPENPFLTLISFRAKARLARAVSSLSFFVSYPSFGFPWYRTNW